MARTLPPAMGDIIPAWIDGRRMWLFPDGTTLPVISGGDGDDAGDDDAGAGAGDDGDADDNGSTDDGDGDQDVAGLKSALQKERDARKTAAAEAKRLREENAKLKKSTMSPDEQALEDAREAARAEERTKNAARLLAAEVRAAAAGRLDDEQRSTLLDGLDASKFLTDDGEVDTEKVKRLVDGLAPADGKSRNKSGGDIGQGRRGGTPKPSVAAGAELYERLRGKQKQNT